MTMLLKLFNFTLALQWFHLYGTSHPEIKALDTHSCNYLPLTTQCMDQW